MTSQQKQIVSRGLFMAGILLLMLVFLISRLFYIQMIAGKNFSRRAANQRMLDLPLDISRGQILDTNMIPLTGRETVNSLVVFPAFIDEKQRAAGLIAADAGLDYSEALNRLEEETAPFKLPVTKDAGIAGENGMRGVMLVKDVERYDENSLARHLIGYIDKRDKMGRAGLEKLYQYYLAGERDVAVAAVVDGSKRVIPGLGYKIVNRSEDIRHYDLQLTLDYHIQKVVEDVMDRYEIDGAVVVLDVDSGGVLAMGSRPNYRQDSVGDYLDGQRGELLNKALQQYNLGSIFKTVVAGVVLERNQVNPFERIYCPGYTYVGDLQVKCSSYDHGGHGELNIYQAFSRSCNTFFIEMGKRAGGEAIIELAKGFGYGTITEINPYEEQPGVLPPVSNIFSADIGNISIGQGNIMVTPLQVADMTNTVANNGVRRKPFVVKALIDGKGNRIDTEGDRKPERIISPFIAMEIRRMMKGVVDEGTGKEARLPGYGGAAGKTSSAQTGQRIGEEEVVHAWFTGYVPAIMPEYVITVLVENGKSGGGVAAPMFRDIAEGIMELGDRGD